MKIFSKGFILTFIFSLILLCVFYGNLLVHCNSVYFGDSRDALESYYTALYHLRYDTSYFHQGGMNYPYGENIFFTGGHIPIIFCLKLLNHIVNVSGYAVGIINISMLLSIVLCALAIYLIFHEFSLPPVYSALAATGIAFLSPQMQRLGGTLAYEFLIPFFMYLLIRFYKKPSLKKSILIGIYTFFALTFHLYFFSFFCFLAFFYWAVLFFSGEKDFSKIEFAAKHLFLQIILPFILLNILLAITNHVNDRTQYPWGFFVYTSSWAGVLYPFGKPYEAIARILCKPHVPEWEGVSYIGATAVCAFFILIIVSLLKIFKKNIPGIFAITDQKIINIFFWASIAALLYSFGYPFIWKKTFFIHYIGPLKEIRALGRCAWLFYYVMNIVAFYSIYHWVKNRHKILKYTLIPISLIVLFTDVYFYVNHYEDSLNSPIDELADTQNNLPANAWLKDIDLKKYQAIIPLPYLNVGSENVWIDGESDLLKYVFIASLKSGIQTTAVILSRTSLRQTYKNISLLLEPYRKLEILKDLPNMKPFLVMVQPDKINKKEKYLLSKCSYIMETPHYALYELPYSVLQHYTDSLYINTENEFRKAKTYAIGDYYSTDSVKDFIHCSYDEMPDSITYIGDGAYCGDINKYNVLYEGSVPTYKDSNYVLSFWMYNFTTDLYPRSTIEIALKDSAGKLYKVDYTAPLHMLMALDGKWALLEHPLEIKHPSDKIKITLWNEDLGKNHTVIIDELWLKPASTDIYRQGKKFIFKNNRYYKSQ